MTEIGKVLPYLNTKDIYKILFEIWKFIMENWQQCPYSDNFTEQQEKNKIGEINYEERVRNVRIIVQKNILKIPDELVHCICNGTNSQLLVSEWSTHWTNSISLAMNSE
jgi:hypothetical protein